MSSVWSPGRGAPRPARKPPSRWLRWSRRLPDYSVVGTAGWCIGIEAEASAMRIEPSAPPKIHDSGYERPVRRLLVLAGTVMLTAVASTGDLPASGHVAPEAKQRVTASYGSLPLHFEANQGQTDDQVEF